MNNKIELPFTTLILLISFASVNAVLFTPALPEIASFFGVSTNTAQQTITWFLVGYAIGQLIYGPLANRFGRKPAIYIGIILQIGSSLLCVFAGMIHIFWLLLVGRFMLALGSGVGLKITFTLVNECYEPEEASPKISYLMLAFAITPGLSLALGGVLTTHFGWMSCFYAGAIYGVILLLLTMRLPETQKVLDLKALEIKHLIHDYGEQFKNIQLLMGGLLMGSSTSFVYVFITLSPFIAIKLLGMNTLQFGFANILPSLGLCIGSLLASQLVRGYSLSFLIRLGLFIVFIGTILMFVTILLKLSAIICLFLPTLIIYCGFSFIYANASVVALSHVHDKSHGAAVMSFLNMGFATIVVLLLGLFSVKELLLPIVYLVLCSIMFLLLRYLDFKHNEE